MPDFLLAAAGKLAQSSGGATVDQLLASALAEKLSAVESDGWLKERGERANRAAYEAALNRALDVESAECDRLPG
ncbi:MAG TPA: hypothetical protein VGI99_09985 [Gemmataceae bacterium]